MCNLLQVSCSHCINTFLDDPCTTADGTYGECVFVNACPKIIQLLQKRPLWSNERDYLRRSQCGWSGNSAKVCCEARTTPAVAASTPKNNLFPKPGECGIQGADRILDGTPTQLDEFPWMALLQYRNSYQQTTFACGGTLINNRYILTAAHCAEVSGWKMFSARLGEWDTSTDPDCVDDDCADAPMDVSVEQVIVHQGYNARDRHVRNDIALVRLTKPVEWTYFIRPICLPIESTLRASAKTYSGEKSTVAGWGKSFFLCHYHFSGT